MNHSEKWYSDFGEYTIDEYVKERFLNNPAEMERFSQIIRLVPAETVTVLDVGCGTGVFLHLLKKERNIEGIGVEIADNKVDYARAHLHVHVEKGDAGNLCFGDRSFDVVVALEVLEHLPYGIYERALKEIARVAKKSIIISVPYNEQRTFITCPYCQSTFNPNYHLRSFREEHIADLFPDFVIDNIEKIGVTNVYPTLVTKAILFWEKDQVPSEFVCPTCGYSRPPRKVYGNNLRQNANSFGTVRILRFLRSLAPKRKKPRWLVAVYNRKL